MSVSIARAAGATTLNVIFCAWRVVRLESGSLMAVGVGSVLDLMGALRWVEEPHEQLMACPGEVGGAVTLEKG